MKLSIIIVNWKTPELLDACLRSLELHPAGLPSEIIVLDNDSADGSVEMVRSKHPNVILIASPTNLGFGGGNNAALARATGDCILLLNPDTEVRAGSLREAIACLMGDADIAAVGARQVEPDGMLQSSCGNFPSLKVMLIQQLMSALTRVKAAFMLPLIVRLSEVPVMPVPALRHLFDFSLDHDVEWIMGSFMLIRREALPADGLFDERFAMYAEDLDLCERLRLGGRRIVYCGRAEILHHGGASVKGISVKAEGMRTTAMIRLYQKYYPRSAWAYRFLLAAGSLIGLAAASLSGRRQDRLLRTVRLRAALKPD